MKYLVRLLGVTVALVVLDSCESCQTPFPPMPSIILRFDDRFPKELVLPDGSHARRLDDIHVLRYDSAPDVNSIGLSIKTSEHSTFPDSMANNSLHHIWLKKSGQVTSLEDSMESLQKKLGDQGYPPKWISPAYQIDSVSGNRGVFVPLPSTLIVKSSLLSSKVSTEFSRIGLHQTSRKLPEHTIFSLDATTTLTTLAIGNYLRSMPVFQDAGSFYFENVPLMRPTLADRYGPQQQAHLDLLHVPEAWALAGTSRVEVALIDMGCNVDDPSDFTFLNKGRRVNNSTIPGSPAPFTDRDHGTEVASLLGAIRDNGKGIAGIGATVDIYPVALVDGSDVEVAEALNASITEGVDIVNMSIGAYVWQCSVLDPVVQLANAKGILLCAASGNEGFSNWMAKPAIDPNVMAIGGSDGDSHWPGANYGDVLYHARLITGISVVAPAVNCATVGHDWGLTWMTGTSAACPQVVGIAALIKSAHPGFTAKQIRSIIEASTDKVGAPDGSYVTVSGYSQETRYAPMGYGRANALKAMQKANEVAAATFSPIPPVNIGWLTGCLVLFVILLSMLKDRSYEKGTIDSVGLLTPRIR